MGCGAVVKDVSSDLDLGRLVSELLLLLLLLLSEHHTSS